MLIMSKIFDQRINSWNLYVESTFGEYLKFAKKIINNNELQRKRVKTSKTIYSLLKNDLQKGCIMPPLVLALVKTDIIDVENPDQEKLLQYINENSKNVLLLDILNEESHKLLRELDNAFIDVLMDMLLTFDTKRGKEDIE